MQFKKIFDCKYNFDNHYQMEIKFSIICAMELISVDEINFTFLPTKP